MALVLASSLGRPSPSKPRSICMPASSGTISLRSSSKPICPLSTSCSRHVDVRSLVSDATHVNEPSTVHGAEPISGPMRPADELCRMPLHENNASTGQHPEKNGLNWAPLGCTGDWLTVSVHHRKGSAKQLVLGIFSARHMLLEDCVELVHLENCCLMAATRARNKAKRTIDWYGNSGETRRGRVCLHTAELRTSYH
jgi:hypothetical protein